MKKIMIIAGVWLFMALFIGTPVQATENVTPQKVWTVKFNTTMDVETVHKNSVYVTKDGVKQDGVQVEYQEQDGKGRVLVYNPEGYEGGTYMIHVTDQLHSKGDLPLKAGVTKEFKVIPDYINMTEQELKEKYGDVVLVRRSDWFGEHGVYEESMMEQWYESWVESGKDKSRAPEPTYDYLLNVEAEYDGITRHFENNYPKYSVISVNGVAYKESDAYSPDKFDEFERVDQRMIDDWLPTHPEKEDGFFVDVALYSPEIVTYLKDDIRLNTMAQGSYMKDGEIMMDIQEIFRDTTLETVREGDSLRISTDNRVFILTVGKTAVTGSNSDLSVSPEINERAIFAPIEDVADLLNLETRHSEAFQVFQIIGGNE